MPRLTSRAWAMTLLVIAPTLAVAFAAGQSSMSRSSSSSSSSSSTQDRSVKMHRGLQKRTSFTVLEEIAHDPDAFTQGLVYEDDGTFLEGTGLYGKSRLRRVNAKTGEVMASQVIAPRYFGEGIVAVDDKIIQITWRERKALVYGRQNLTLLNEFVYDTSNHEGWGITTDGNRLIVSDGSSNLHFWDKTTYQEIPNSRLRVEDGFGNAVKHLNELEYAHGYVWANIWLADDIVQIDPSTGKVVAFYDFSALYPQSQRVSVDQVLNGIAFDSTEDVFYLTGKWWPKYYKIKMCIEEGAVCAAEGGAGGALPAQP